MKLVLDEMHAPVAAAALNDEGWDVVAVATVAGLRGTPDEELLTWAANEGRLLVTENIADFAAIAARWTAEHRDHAGLIFTSPKRFNRATLAYPGDLIAALRALLQDPPDLGASAVWWL
ncbi:MAG: DUF5615 family PIN-like protein [Acidimicrobiales bacterium]